ncbi:hypothetical protein [Sporosarcina aquimarina]|uniref:Lipoprotein n=1 Tax=Sporosarcina aquimarina TaxID=114975 RepID=A0ABU4G0N0_9BACL|nr:hypothetical protein [Sporosarcina aquimarina]MDW0110529.1 hypothetical protein [Sporosarcina aquimarina]
MSEKLGLIMVLLLLFVCSGCSVWNAVRGCPDGEIEWIDSLKLNDISYTGDFNGVSTESSFEKGDKVGEVKYMMADHACSNHKARNGDAAFLPVGTEVYKAAGYRTDFRVIAEDRVFQVRENKAAGTIGELYDIEGKVTGISLESEVDNSQIAEVTGEQTKSFIEEYLSLDYVGYDKVMDDVEGNNRVFLRIHLQDGSSFLESYWLDKNVIITGAYGTDRMKSIIEEEMRQ